MPITTMQVQQKRKQISGDDAFTLIELLIMMVIVGLASTWALPAWHRQLLQGQVDQYTAQLETGLFDLKAMAGKEKISFIATPPYIDTFREPWEMIEFTKNDGTRINGSDQRLCVIHGDNQPACDTTSVNNPRNPRYRFLKLENSRQSREVEIKIKLNGLQTKFEITPPGTINYEDVVFIIRSKKASESSNQKVKERCILLSGNGYLRSGTWDDSCQ